MKTELNISLKPFNTFGIDAKCERFITVENDSEVSYLFENKVFDSPFLILGGGSNILFAGDFKGTVVQMTNKGIEKIAETESDVFLKVAAGEKWEDFVNYCIERNYYGVENLIGIPGCVGSSPVQNIGAYGVEVKDVIERVLGYYTETALPFSIHQNDCEFEYRNSVFKNELRNKVLITNVIFKLSKTEQYHLEYAALKDELNKSNKKLSLRYVADAVINVRNSKLPDITKIGSAGSFFKNPLVKKELLEKMLIHYPNLIHYPFNEYEEKLSAGQLIDMAGWKGVREGNVGVYPLQALVLVNYGNATGKEIVAFYKKIQHSVDMKFGIAIEPEVNIVVS
jgi:UDP-N-acetylmuramate dehydrogenase